MTHGAKGVDNSPPLVRMEPPNLLYDVSFSDETCRRPCAIREPFQPAIIMLQNLAGSQRLSVKRLPNRLRLGPSETHTLSAVAGWGPWTADPSSFGRRRWPVESQTSFPRPRAFKTDVLAVSQALGLSPKFNGSRRSSSKPYPPGTSVTSPPPRGPLRPQVSPEGGVGAAAGGAGRSGPGRRPGRGGSGAASPTPRRGPHAGGPDRSPVCGSDAVPSTTPLRGRGRWEETGEESILFVILGDWWVGPTGS